MSDPISPAPVTEPKPDYLPAYVANGVIGLHVREIPLLGGVAIVNGGVGIHPTLRVEVAPYMPYPLAGDLCLDEVWLSDLPHHARFVEQTYDFTCGELHTRFDFAVDGGEARVEVLTFCSRTQPYLVLQEVTVTVNRECDATLCAVVDPADIAGHWVPDPPPSLSQVESIVDGARLWEPLGALSTCGIAYTTELDGDGIPEQTKMPWEKSGPLATGYSFHARPGRRYRLRQMVAMVASAVHYQPDLEAVRLIALGRELGFDALREENRAAWADLWKGRVHLLGADRHWQALADAAFFYLNSSAHPSSHASTHMFGLARWHNYHYYYGHVMWDIETFALPPLLFTQPDAALAIVEYRIRSIGGARSNARLNGYRGLQFPWASDPVHGEEVTQPGAATALYEQHVSLSVALACARYAHATGDAYFEREHAWPVLHGVAEWIASRVTRSARGYEIRRALGIAERDEPADNDAYVNMAASVVLREAIACAERLGFQVPHRWPAIARGLVVPGDERTSVILAHDGYRPDEPKGATPEPLAGLWPVGYQTSKAVEEATIRYYLDLAPEYVGSPMLSAFLGTWAARLGDRARSAALFEEGYAAFVSDRFYDTHEYRKDKFPEQPVAGPFIANIGGFLMGCLYGLPGLRLGPGKPETWCERPVVMPAGWDGVEVGRVWVRGRPAHLLARHGDERARLVMLPDEE